MKRKNQQILWRILVFFGIVTAFFYLLIAAAMPKYKAPSTPEEIAGIDLSQDYICLSSEHAERYPGRLYGREDFAEGRADRGDPDAKYETCRIRLSLKPGKTYGITGQTATYAQRVYVNGELLNETGIVGDAPSGFVPRTDLYTVYFTPQEEETEIIVQHAWFNHERGALHKLFLAEQQVITRTERAQDLCDGLVAGTLLAMSIFFFGMFLFHLSSYAMLWFSLSSLCAALNYLLYESKQIMTLFPQLSWYVCHKTELLTNIYYFVFAALFAFSILQWRPPKWFSIFSVCFVGALTVFYLLAPSTLYTGYTVFIGAGMLLYEVLTVAILLGLCVRKKKLCQAEHLIVCLSLLMVLIVYGIEGLTYFSHIFYLRAYAMILLAFCNALILTIRYAKTEQSLNEAQRRELAVAEENMMLEKMSHLKNDFMRNLAHELKTPLTVMSGYAQLTERQIRKNAVNEETAANLETIAREAGRLADMVTKLLDVTYQEVSVNQATTFYPYELLEDAAAVCRPVLLKNGNRIELICESQKKLTANREALLQVLINLAVNSNKHTKDGTIVFRAAESAEKGILDFFVMDSGSGISESVLPYIFERGCATDGGNGLGLNICRNIMESMGGTIRVEKTGPDGTAIRFSIPDGEEV